MLVFGLTLFFLRDSGSGMIFMILVTVLATEPALLNRCVSLVNYAVPFIL